MHRKCTQERTWLCEGEGGGEGVAPHALQLGGLLQQLATADARSGALRQIKRLKPIHAHRSNICCPRD